VDNALAELRIDFLENDKPHLAEQVPATYRQLKIVLDKMYGHKHYLYDVCPEKQQDGKLCFAIYRCEFRDCESCPKCGADRYKLNSKKQKQARMQVIYNPLSECLRRTLSIPQFARYALALALSSALQS
jgi:hypothetical protein